jgi:hypothetical protein
MFGKELILFLKYVEETYFVAIIDMESACSFLG